MIIKMMFYDDKLDLKLVRAVQIKTFRKFCNQEARIKLHWIYQQEKEQ